MRRIFTALATVLLLVVAAEFYFAASGAFGSGGGSGGDSYRPHHVLGYVIFTLPLVMAGVAAPARMPRKLIGLPLLVVALTGVQVAVAKLAWAAGDAGGQAIFGLHALGGMAIAAVAAATVRQAWALSRPGTDPRFGSSRAVPAGTDAPS